MAIRKRKPTSPGRRFQTSSDFSEITTSTPEKSLLAPKSKTGGRNNHGRKTSRHRGGGHKQQYRIIDFHRSKDGVPATVATIEYDPNRTCNIALLHYHDGEKRYILAPREVQVGDKLEFRGLIASLDGKEILETSKSGEWSFESGQAIGTEAGAELKAQAPESFFAMLLENGGNW